MSSNSTSGRTSRNSGSRSPNVSVPRSVCYKPISVVTLSLPRRGQHSWPLLLLFGSHVCPLLRRWLNIKFHLIRAPATRYTSLMPALGQPSSLFLVSVSHRRQSATRVASGSSMCTFFSLHLFIIQNSRLCPSLFRRLATTTDGPEPSPSCIQAHAHPVTPLAPSNNTRTTIVNPVYRTTGQSRPATMRCNQ